MPDPEICDASKTERGEAFRHREFPRLERYLERKVEVPSRVGELRLWSLSIRMR